MGRLMHGAKMKISIDNPGKNKTNMQLSLVSFNQIMGRFVIVI
jgi:hypothetical protein